jgi:GNAT superfamily N-acetyltransferase
MTKKEKIKGDRGIKILLEKDGKLMGRAYLYLIENDLHDKPYGLLEDLYIEEEYRGQKIGSELVQAVIDEAKKLGCYKLISQSRYDREKVHEFYKKLGFKDYGKNFRLDL